MKLRQVKGSTYVIEIEQEMTIPLYRISNKEVILLDSGYRRDWGELLALLEAEDLMVKAVLGSHVHMDHSGNHMHLKERFGAEIYLSAQEAAIGSNPMMGKLSYFLSSPGQVEALFGGMLTETDHALGPDQSEVEICGCTFAIVQLPGHTPGHIGIVTPDQVFYVGDALVSPRVLKRSKVPTCFSYAADLESKKKLLQMDYDRYILAHHGVYREIRDITLYNIEHRQEKIEEILSLISGAVTMDELSQAVFRGLEMRTQDPARIAVYRRNLHCLVEYLLDQEILQQFFDAGVTVYARA